MHEVLVNRLGGLSLPRKSVVRLTDRPDMTLDVYRGRKTTMQQQQQQLFLLSCMGTLPCFSAIFVKGNNICYLLLASLDEIDHPNWGQLLKKKEFPLSE